MTHRGRKSAASLAIVTPSGPEERLLPPAFLSAAERAIFADITASVSQKHFRPGDLPLLIAYVQAIATQQRANSEFKRAPFGPTGRPSGWIAVEEKAVRSMVALSMRLRLSPQSRDRHEPSRQAKKLSYYERAALAQSPAYEEAADDE
jgi:hypothetical protein